MILVDTSVPFPGQSLRPPAYTDNLSDMKKTASVAEFTKRFGPITNALAPGESVQVTSYGKPVPRKGDARFDYLTRKHRGMR